MNFEELVGRLENVRPRWGYLMARCPAHEDRVQSLSIIRRDDGRPWLTCHAGCTFQEILAALSEEADLLTLGRGVSGGSRGLLPPPSSESAKRPAHLDGFENIYDYVDENGVLLFKVCRTSDKRFFQCHPDPESPTGFFWGRGGARILPYRLPRLRKAVEAGQTVYIVEGEKDVHAIERAGGVATCNPGGASKGKSKWRSDWNEYFDGALVAIVADKDEIGRAHALDIQANLKPHARRVIVVEPLVGKDAHDHLSLGFGLGAFV